MMNSEEQQQLRDLLAENERLKSQAMNLADANVYAAELLAALEEAHDREKALVQRGEELELQTRLDLVLQEERDEFRLLKRVADELLDTESIGLVAIEPSTLELSTLDGTNHRVSDMAPLHIDPGSFCVPVWRDGQQLRVLEVHINDVSERWCERWLRLLWSVGRQAGGALQRLHVANENERMTEELIEARDQALESSRIKSAFLANMSHELRTPMNAILGYSEMLIEDIDCMSTDTVTQDLKKIQSAGKHLLNLINDVLDLSRIEAGKMTLYVEPVEVKRLVEGIVDTVQPLIDKNGNQLHVDLYDQIGVMVTDLVKVQQSLLNLLSNAAKFTQQGSVTLRVQCVESGSGERIQFTVTDSGIGMTEQQVTQLFQDFVQADSSTTRKYGGTGLGLSISRRFCQMLGGDIRVESRTGVGSRFTIDLPRVSQASTGEDHSLAKDNDQQIDLSVDTTEILLQRQSLGDLVVPTILAIDDNEDSLEIIKRSLEKDGFQVVTASSGRHGLELARSIRPDIITLDVNMPGLNGWQVLATIKADDQLNAIPVVLLSVVENRDIGMALGAVDCLAKPIDWVRLASVLERHTKVKAQNKILIVEDDPASSEIVVRLLSRRGWKIETAVNGHEAMQRIEEGNPALIVLDLMMPVMDGFEFIEKLHEHEDYRDIPIVVLTSKSLTPEDHRRLNGQVETIMNKGDGARQLLLDSIKHLLLEPDDGSANV
jgi:signal transduction histidine kinase/CheY-like chemotaxis protein